MEGHLLMGVKTKDFVLVVSDLNVTSARSTRIPLELNKEVLLGESLLLTCVGDTGDLQDFTTWSKACLGLYKHRNDGKGLDPNQAGYWLRRRLAESIRSRRPWYVNMLLSGYDKRTDEFFLSHFDYLGDTFGNQNYLFVGPGGWFCYAIMDSLFTNSMTEQQACKAIKQCVGTVSKREMGLPRRYSCTIIDRRGLRHLDKITVDTARIADDVLLAKGDGWQGQAHADEDMDK